MAVASDIIQNIAKVLRDSGAFGEVTFDQAGSGAVPLVSIALEKQEALPADDSPDSLWMRIIVAISIRTSSETVGQAAARLFELYQAACGAILADSFRGQRTKDLPVGKATEVGNLEMSKTPNRPHYEARFVVRCHFEVTN